ncbi:unnamed protein product [Mytilus edulis]|uniref:Uncharacterized protein n=1 Tax=Mytilus edulis TaxID=6550 RepID=A0A8S3PTB9_MYTED|nr:unnamed protein product [Mytilus edulis]
MSSEVIDLSTQEDIICISDDDHEVKKAEANQVCNTQGFDGVEEIEVLEKSESPPQSQSRNLPLKNEIDIESLKLAFQKTLQERKSMGCTKTPPPIKPLKFRPQMTWSKLKSEKEKEKMVMSPKMPRLNREPVYISSESENEEEEEELPDLDDYSEVINISDDEMGESSVKKSVLSLNCTSLDSDNESKTSMDRSSYCISTDEDEEGTTVVTVQIVSCSEDTDDTTYSSPKCKRRKMSEYLPDTSLADCTDNKTEDDNDLEIISDEIEKENKTEVVQKIWTDENKTKLANLLNGVKTSLNLKNKSGLQDQKESELKETGDNSKSVLREISNSPTSSRHFTDLLKCDDSEDSETEYVQVKKRRRKNKMRKIVKKEDSDCGQITSYFSSVKKDIHKKCFWQRLKSNIVNSRMDNDIENVLVGAFSQFHINTVEGCWEDEQNPSFMRHGLKFLKNFSKSYSPPPELIERVIEQGIMTSSSLELLKESVDCLMLVYDKYPEMLHIDFKHLQDSLECLNFGKSFSDQSHLLVRKTVYLLKLVILFYEYELTTRNVSDPKAMRKTASYKALSYDCGFNNVKELIVNYIVPLLHHEQTFQNEIPEILPLLQKLLHISVEVSSNCNAAARAIALELSKPYCYLPTIDHKKLYIQTLESSLLRYYLVTVVLERQCENTAPCYDFPCRFQDVFNCFFQAYPPTNISTPPTTPQSEDDSMDGYNPNSTAGYPAINVEELLMLLFEVLQCYVQCEQDKSIATLRRRAYMKKEDFTMQLTDKDKDLILQGIEELRGRVLTLTPDLTPVSEKYLQLMLCVVDWQKCMN